MTTNSTIHILHKKYKEICEIIFFEPILHNQRVLWKMANPPHNQNLLLEIGAIADTDSIKK
jgi:hypothetical protein